MKVEAKTEAQRDARPAIGLQQIEALSREVIAAMQTIRVAGG